MAKAKIFTMLTLTGGKIAG